MALVQLPVHDLLHRCRLAGVIMVTTQRYCYGVCFSDSFYGHQDHIKAKGVTFMPFPKPHMDVRFEWSPGCMTHQSNLFTQTYG